MQVEFEQLRGSPLVVDAIYKAKDKDPLPNLTPGVGTEGGIRRARSDDRTHTCFIDLQMTGKEKTWPDFVDAKTGICTYFGDNRSPEKELLETKGNKELARVFSRPLDSEESRKESPPFFLFENAREEKGKSMRFRGLAVPGASAPRHQWCTSMRFTTETDSYWNLVVTLTVLAVKVVSHDWIIELKRGDVLGENCPDWYRHWVKTGERVAMSRSDNY